MNLHERALSVLACKYVDEVIIGSPMIITDDLIKTFNISVIVRGSVTETSFAHAAGTITGSRQGSSHNLATAANGAISGSQAAATSTPGATDEVRRMGGEGLGGRWPTNMHHQHLGGWEYALAAVRLGKVLV